MNLNIPSPPGFVAGFRLIVNPVPMKTVQARRHNRKSSRRWQKKWLKRFGTVSVPAISAEDQQKLLVDERAGIIYCYRPAEMYIRAMLQGGF